MSFGLKKLRRVDEHSQKHSLFVWSNISGPLKNTDILKRDRSARKGNKQEERGRRKREREERERGKKEREKRKKEEEGEEARMKM